MATGAGQFHKYLMQQRAMGRSEPTRSDKAAFLQGDIQARLAMSDQMRRTSLAERGQAAQESQFQQSHRAEKDRWRDQMYMQKQAQKERDRWNKIRGWTEVAKLGIEAAPYLKGGYDWMAGKFGGGGDDYGGGYDFDYSDSFETDYGDADYAPVDYEPTYGYEGAAESAYDIPPSTPSFAETFDTSFFDF